MSPRLPSRTLEAQIARLLMAGTYGSIGLVAIGAVLMALHGLGPLEKAPAFDPGRLLDDVRALQPAGFLWLGILVVLATPLARVLAALAGYLRAGEREMAIVAALIVVVVAVGVVAGTLGG